MREDILETNKPQQDLITGVGVQCVADDVEFDDAAFFLETCGLITRGVCSKQARLQQVKLKVKVNVYLHSASS